MNIAPVAKTLKLEVNKWNPLKLRSFCKAKDKINKTYRMGKDLQLPISDRGLISKIYKEIKKLNIKIHNNPIKIAEQV